MDFTREAWENAPKGARLEYGGFDWKSVILIGFSINGRPVVEDSLGGVWACSNNVLRIVLPKRKVTVQLWRNNRDGGLDTRHDNHPWKPDDKAWTFLGEHTFEIEGE